MSYDLCECYNKTHKSTLIYNVPYKLCRGQKKKIDIGKYPKGTYFVVTKNGESPIKKQRDAKKKLDSRVNRNTSGVHTPMDNVSYSFFPGSDYVGKQEELFLQRMFEEGKISQPYLPEDYEIRNHYNQERNI